MNVLNCSIRKSGEGFEGNIDLDGLRRTKLVKSSDGKTVYSSRSGVISAAKKMAERFGLEVSIEDTTTKSKPAKTMKPASKPLEVEAF